MSFFHKFISVLEEVATKIPEIVTAEFTGGPIAAATVGGADIVKAVADQFSNNPSPIPTFQQVLAEPSTQTLVQEVEDKLISAEAGFFENFDKKNFNQAQRDQLTNIAQQLTLFGLGFANAELLKGNALPPATN